MSRATLSAERVERVDLPSGQDGVDATIRAMARMAMGEYGAGSPRIRALALRIIHDAGVAERDQRGEVAAIHEWVKAHLRYVRDPLWYEFVTYPETLAFEQFDGDCDDHAVLEAALLGAIGIPTRFVTYSFRGNTPSHVALRALVGQTWIALDPIVKNKPAGWEVPDASATDPYGINGPDGPVSGASGVRRVVVAGGIIVGLWWGFARWCRAWEER